MENFIVVAISALSISMSIASLYLNYITYRRYPPFKGPVVLPNGKILVPVGTKISPINEHVIEWKCN